MGDEEKVEALLARPGVDLLSLKTLKREANGLVAQLPAGARATDGGSLEAAMAAELEACGWSKFAVAFQNTGTWFPMAHNKIAAVRRDGWRRIAFSWLEGTEEGDELMGHIADCILASARS